MKRIKLACGRYTKVDDEDFPVLARFNWNLSTGTACYVKNYSLGLLHRFILGYPRYKVIDHKNGNKLDNQKSNLRICSSSENNCNRQRLAKGFLKILNRALSKPFRPHISINGKRIYLGYFKTKKEAILARENAVIKYHGEFTRLKRRKNNEHAN